MRFWVSHAGAYPILHKVALRICLTPPSSVASKRDFSFVNNLFAAGKTRLADDTIAELAFLKSGMNNGEVLNEN